MAGPADFVLNPLPASVQWNTSGFALRQVGDAGLDRVTDFSRTEGELVYLLPGTQYTLAQEGADVALNMVGGGKRVLVGVQLASLTGDRIFGA
ncbi:hypothetical protein [Phenylobacterium sp. J367]|uniref:hypothetical protein n=1 Tax=Phenylobacterium sp. J367 TaxID=2898435 RepID=UPI002150BAC0|nr:hypothetical protein [Phenylobacterium sp. J367]MCR5880290.1 hypothetical protein [Phenylobacterium sp. J367]